MLRRPLKAWILGFTAAFLGVMMLAQPVPAWASVAKDKHVRAPVRAKAAFAVRHRAKRPQVAVRRLPRMQPRRPMAAMAPAARYVPVVAQPSPRSSFGEGYGLGAAHDPLALKSNAALVVDQDSGETLVTKNARAVLPIASLTKLMTSVVVIEAGMDLGEWLTISSEDIDTEKGSRSRLAIGTQLTRADMLHLALMSSENRAANALGRHYPGGLPAFVAAMNRKAQELGMADTHYVEPTGLSSSNQSSARDLATLVKHAYQHALIRELSTSPESEVLVGERALQFRNTNLLVRKADWEIGLQKTGYISEAGRCLVMQARLAGRRLIMVFLDSAGKYSRLADAERVRHWLENGNTDPAHATLVSHVEGRY